MRVPVPRIYYGWWIVLSYFVINFYWSGALLTGMSALFNPLREAFGLSVTLTTVAISLRMGLAAVGAPIVGYLFDRVGPRPLMLVATVAAAGGMSLLVFAHSTWLFFLAFAISGVGIAIFAAGTGPAIAATWFVRQRGKAIGLLIAGAGVGAFLVPVLVWLEGAWGLRTTIAIIAVGLMVVGVPTSLVLRHRPERYGLRPDGDPPVGPPTQLAAGVAGPAVPPVEGDYPSFREAMRSAAFWLPAAGAGLVALGSTSVILFTIPYLEDEGFSRTTGALSITAMGVVGVAGTLGLGWLSDHMERRTLLAFSYLMQGAGIAVLAFITSAWQLAPFALLFGLGGRASAAVVASLLADYFGRANTGKVQGVLVSMIAAGGALGPIAGAMVRDSLDSYTPIFAGYSEATAIAVLAVLLARRPQMLRSPVPVEPAVGR